MGYFTSFSEYFWHFRSDFFKLFFDCIEMLSSSLLGKHLVSKEARLVARLGRKVPSLGNLDLLRRLLKVRKSGKKKLANLDPAKVSQKAPLLIPFSCTDQTSSISQRKYKKIKRKVKFSAKIHEHGCQIGRLLRTWGKLRKKTVKGQVFTD